jgi:hypothetical protein
MTVDEEEVCLYLISTLLKISHTAKFRNGQGLLSLRPKLK